MGKPVVIIGAGLAGSEAALQLAERGIDVELHEMRPTRMTPVHRTSGCAELVCSNSLKSLKEDSAAGMLKHELRELGSRLFAFASQNAVPAGGALAVDRDRFSDAVTRSIERHPHIKLVREEVCGIEGFFPLAQAIILATGPLTSDALSESIAGFIGSESLAFFDAAAPIVMASSLDTSALFRQSRYEAADNAEGAKSAASPIGDYLNAPFDKGEYERFIDALIGAERVILREFEPRDLFQACQPIEEIARAGRDAPRFGPLKPVGLIDPRTGRRPWAALQLRAENIEQTAYNLVGFQTNLKFSEQKRVFGLIPGLENAEFSRFGVMHRNTFVDAPRVLDASLRVKTSRIGKSTTPVFIAGQLGGTEGYCEAIRSGLHAALSVMALLNASQPIPLPKETAFGALVDHATSEQTVDYQPMHVNFGIMPALDPPIRSKRERYTAYADRGRQALASYIDDLRRVGLMVSR